MNEAKWDKIRKEISKENNEILNEKRRSKVVKSNGVSIRKLQLEKRKPAKFSQQTHRNTRLFRRITRPFIHFTTVSEGKVPFLRRKLQHFDSLCWSKMISLQVFPRIRAVRTRGPDGKIRTAGARLISQSDSRI